jgi:hypothetical protein
MSNGAAPGRAPGVVERILQEVARLLRVGHDPAQEAQQVAQQVALVRFQQRREAGQGVRRSGCRFAGLTHALLFR